MNAKEAEELISTKKEYPANGNGCNYFWSKGFLEATKAAEPLLKEILNLQERLSEEKQCGAMFGENYCTRGKKCLSCLTLSSSASVVNKYRKETLGEI